MRLAPYCQDRHGLLDVLLERWTNALNKEPTLNKSPFKTAKASFLEGLCFTGL